ncbi:MAG: hypothetical protein AB7W37_06560 [Syntrophobacteraceae bacterium]
MSDVLILKGALQEARQASMRHATQAEGLISSIRNLAQHAAVIPLRELRTKELLEMARQLDDTVDRYRRERERVAAIRRDLGMPPEMGAYE